MPGARKARRERHDEDVYGSAEKHAEQVGRARRQETPEAPRGEKIEDHGEEGLRTEHNRGDDDRSGRT